MKELSAVECAAVSGSGLFDANRQSQARVAPAAYPCPTGGSLTVGGGVFAGIGIFPFFAGIAKGFVKSWYY